MVLKHHALDHADEVRLFQHSFASGLVERGKVAEAHERLEVLQSIVFSIQKMANWTHHVNGLKKVDFFTSRSNVGKM